VFMARLCAEGTASDGRTSKDTLPNTLGEELSAAWARFYAIEVDSRLGEP